MNSNYLTAAIESGPTRRRGLALGIFFILASIIISSATLGLWFAPDAKADDEGNQALWEKVLCSWYEDGSDPRDIYQYTQTSDLQFNLFSKSTLGTNFDDVQNSALNALLNFVNTEGGSKPAQSFQNRNEVILGIEDGKNTGKDKTSPLDDRAKPKDADKLNVGPNLNFFDRFGVAGLRFSSYAGEWRHYWIDACSADFSEPTEPSEVVGADGLTPATSSDGATTPGQIRMGSLNVDWGRRFPAVSNDFNKVAPKVDAIGLQEAKNINPVKLVDSSWNVYQPQGNSAIRGSAMLTRSSLGEVVATGSTKMSSKLGSVVQDRYVSWQDVKTGGKTIRLASVHWPPQPQASSRHQQFADNFIRWAKSSPYPLLVAGDWNQQVSGRQFGGRANSIKRMERELGVYFTGQSIDGIMASNSIKILSKQFVGVSAAKHRGVVGTYDITNAEDPNGNEPTQNDDYTSGSGSTTISLPDGGHGMFYEGRLIPRSTWDDIERSKDARTKQFSTSYNDRFNAAISANLVNWIFGVTKFVVVLTIAIVGLAFSDVSTALGLTKIITGESAGTGMVNGRSSSDGLIGALYTGIFEPLLVLAFVGTGAYILWKGIFRRETRAALSGLATSLACLFGGIIVFTTPSFFVSLPNNIAVVGQSLIASAMGQAAEANGDNFCSSNVGGAYIESHGSTDVVESQGLLTEASLKFRSQMGCSLYRYLLVRPWLEGQFGETDLAKLNGLQYAKDGNRNTPFVNNTGDKEREGWVGKPEVPRGNGKYYNNWALFQISSQTNAHYPVGYKESLKLPDDTQGVTVDWWRVVDAVSNYQEGFKDGSPAAGSGDSATVEFTGPLPAQVMPQWDDWVGNNEGHRFGVALSSLFIAIVAVLAPLIFSFAAVMYAIGVSLLMIFAPIMFLFGCWAGHGWNIFKAWAELVINLTLSRLALGVLVVLSIAFTTTAIKLMDTLGYWQGIVLLIVTSFGLWKSKQKILDSVAAVKFASYSMAGSAKTVTDKVKTIGRTTGRVGTGVAVGGIQSKRYGGSVAGGTFAAIRNEIESLSYRSSTVGNIIRSGRQSYQGAGGFSDLEGKLCPLCQLPFEQGEPLSEHKDWGLIHQRDIYEGRADMDDILEEQAGVINFDKKRRGKIYKDSVFESSKTAQKHRQDLIQLAEDEAASLDMKVDAIQDLVKDAMDDLQRHESNKSYAHTFNRDKGGKEPPTLVIPEYFAKYVDQRALEIADRRGETEYLKMAYTAAIIEYARDLDDEIAEGLTQEQIAEIFATGSRTDDDDWLR